MNKFTKKIKEFVDKIDERLLYSGSLSVKEQVLFARRLSFLVGSGVSILESLYILKEQSVSRRVNKILERVIKDVSNGRFLSVALSRFKNQFGEFTINIIRVGETSGGLSVNLRYLAIELEKKAALRRTVLSALVYPIFISIATLGVTALLTVYIFPKILPIFASVGVKLPLSTRILIFVSDFLRTYGIWLILGLGVFFITYLFLHRGVPKFRMFSDNLLLRIPIAGKIMQNYNMANFTRTFGLLLKSGVTVVEAIESTALSTRNRVYQKELKRSSNQVARGEPVSEYLRKRKTYFPVLVPHMISIGEKTGNLSATLIYLSEMYEEEVDSMTKNLSHSIEPILMVIMGLMVGFIAVSVITPIYEITQTISNQI